MLIGQQNSTDVVARLNDRYKTRFGEYTIHAVRRYIQLLRTDTKYRTPPHGHKRFNHFSSEIQRYRTVHRSELCVVSSPLHPVHIAHKRTYGLSLCKHDNDSRYCCVTCVTGQLSTKDTVVRLKSLEDGERVTVLAEFADSYGPLLLRTLRARTSKYEAELMNILITAAVAIFGDEQNTASALRRTRFFSKTSKPRRRYVHSSHELSVLHATPRI
jgi:hypothetical protein